jgi:hypothetical protein
MASNAFDLKERISNGSGCGVRFRGAWRSRVTGTNTSYVGDALPRSACFSPSSCVKECGEGSRAR